VRGWVPSNSDIGVTKLTLDVLKPREISITDLALALGEIKGINNVEIYVTEVDAKTETLKITISGWNIPPEEIEELINKYGSIRSIDAVVVSRKRQ